ncbi:MAG: hypothetical protein QOH39_1946 [Verrucomicrobiota bacterium]
MRAIVVALAFVLVGCAGSSSHQPYAKDWGLWSWKPSGQPWHYALVYPLDQTRPVDDYKIMHSRDIVVGEAALKRRLAAFPHGTSIIWSDDPPRNILAYPSRATRERITNWSYELGSRVWVNPTIE